VELGIFRLVVGHCSSKNTPALLKQLPTEPIGAARRAKRGCVALMRLGGGVQIASHITSSSPL
jgi:hypothetical protein